MGPESKSPPARTQASLLPPGHPLAPLVPHNMQELLLSYNIGVPVDQREKDMNQRAAQLVGLRMPERQPHVDGE